MLLRNGTLIRSKARRSRLFAVPLELKEANAFIEQHHRHHGRAQGHRFSVGAVTETGTLVGCAVVGRPVSGLDPKKILEITRLCSDGTSNVCSFLYGVVARVGRELGYEFVQTYIYEAEHGVSLKAAGWEFMRKAHPSGRHRNRTDGKDRDVTHVALVKTLWVKRCNGTTDFASLGHHRRTQ